MRRGAPISEGKVPVMSSHPADLESPDLEGGVGGGYDKTHKAKQSPSAAYGQSMGYGGNNGISMGGSTMSMSGDSSHGSLNSYGNGAVRRKPSNNSGWNRFIFSLLTQHHPETIKIATYVLLGGTFVLSLMLPLTHRILLFLYTAVGLGVLGSLYLSRSVLECDDGTEAMRAVSDPIREGAEGFLRVQYTVRYS